MQYTSSEHRDRVDLWCLSSGGSEWRVSWLMALMLKLGHSTHHTSGDMRQLGFMLDDIAFNHINGYTNLVKWKKYFMEVYIILVQQTKHYM